MHRFFILTDSMKGEIITFDNAISHQIGHVLRLREGGRIIICDNTGTEYVCEIISLGENCTARITEKLKGLPEPSLKITLCQSLIKSDKMEWLLQKGTEIGVSAFAPVNASRTAVSAKEVSANKMERWKRIVQEAAEQCGRSRIPEILPPAKFKDAIKSFKDVPVFFINENENQISLKKAADSIKNQSQKDVVLFIGPEGGWDQSEVALAESAGARSLSLGRRILRAETAGIVASTILLYEAGELELRG